MLALDDDRIDGLDIHIPWEIDPGVLADLRDIGIDGGLALWFCINGGNMGLGQALADQAGGIACIDEVVDNQPALALADDGGIYVSVFAGIDAPDDEKINGRNAAGDLRDIDVALDGGKIIGVALGIASADSSWGRLRGELELSLRKSDLDGLTLNGVPRTVIARSFPMALLRQLKKGS